MENAKLLGVSGATRLGNFDRINRIDRMTSAARIASRHPVHPVDPVKTSSPLTAVMRVTGVRVQLPDTLGKCCLLF